MYINRLIDKRLRDWANAKSRKPLLLCGARQVGKSSSVRHNAISSLRFFYEDYPQQHIIAAGSLLEFALAKISSFGVGRITNLFMYPFSFSEFMRACGYEKLDEEIKKHSPQNPIFEAFHTKITVWA